MYFNNYAKNQKVMTDQNQDFVNFLVNLTHPKMRDLSDYSHPITDLFEQPKTEAEWEKYRLSQDQVDFFHENGYLSGIKLLDEDQIRVLKEALEKVSNPKHPMHHLFHEFHSNESSDPNQVLFHSLGHWRIHPAFHDVIWNPAFLMASSQLLGDKSVRFWHDQLFCKPAKHGGNVAWHQDYSYWTRTVAMQHLTCWCGLDDATEANGCLNYIPGSHRWGLLDKPALAGEMDGLKTMLTEQQLKEFNPVAVPLKAGYATFHHPLMVHGSFANYSENARRAFVLNVFADGTVSDTNEPLLQGVPIIPKGQKMEGKFFPKIFEIK
ncbi:Ectoine hydroxylase-related dioxygenase, phytanoyl-CoA dioxygenase (PhyH) family [Algoriphagus halophilus]|uniref:Ectoine hydroxylase-related dioxygenase, phytanoyl-CoA dioxygenase (PhyH) family n=2 Tax=Algoriphagus halophilus TaxID=226505 RepID=A0A1N6H399_9BACT|nr:Ectoine hydroxylase-related dioxygenase, phytanoyl-CoA dioxygenase (PhyH) family [Algoriphagus halophilus]